jgi:hypothetical protein
LPDRADSRVFAGFLRKPADFGIRPMALSKAAFFSLLAIFLSGLAPPDTPEVRKGRNAVPYRSMAYARTNQAVGLQHRPTKGNHTVHASAEAV